MTFLELALLAGDGRLSFEGGVRDFFESVEANPAVRVLQLTPRIALEAATLRPLRDPADRVIAATANVEDLRLLTSDQRMIDSGLVAVIE